MLPTIHYRKARSRALANCDSDDTHEQYSCPWNEPWLVNGKGAQFGQNLLYIVQTGLFMWTVIYWKQSLWDAHSMVSSESMINFQRCSTDSSKEFKIHSHLFRECLAFYHETSCNGPVCIEKVCYRPPGDAATLSVISLSLSTLAPDARIVAAVYLTLARTWGMSPQVVFCAVRHIFEARGLIFLKCCCFNLF